jgi:cyclopropane-fatty-acyl-phospholipid synthase
LDKMDLIARKLMLKPGMTVLDIGCGWGGLAHFLAEKYQVKVLGCTISEEQIKFAKERFKHPLVDIRNLDYRDINQQFDRIVSVGMFEHVGEHNYPTFFKVAHRCLKDDGIFLVHTIGINHNNMPLVDPFVHKYIFANGSLPYMTHIPKYTEGLFIIEDWHNFGYDYYRTLLAWQENFAKSWPKLKSNYDERFYRMWTFYLLMAAGFFRSRKLNLWQVVLSKNGLEGGYCSQR